MPPQMKKQTDKQQRRQCTFCLSNTSIIDYKDTELLRQFVNAQFKIKPRRRTGTCATCQRRLTRAVKYARLMALLPFTLR